MVASAGAAEGGLLNRAAQAITKRLTSFARASEFGIRSYKELGEALGTGSGLVRHHIVEQRFARVLNIVNTDNMLSIVLTKEEHQVFTNSWRQAIPYGTDYAQASREFLWSKAQEIYANYPELLEAARKTIWETIAK
jgi:hypothetical protein